MALGAGEAAKIAPLTDAGGGKVQDKERALLEAIIAQVNELFGDEVTEQDGLIYLKDTLMGKLLESEVLRQQAANNTEEQFATSPDLPSELLSAVMDALDAHSVMSGHILDSDAVRGKILGILLNELGLWRALRARGANEGNADLLEAAEATEPGYGAKGRRRRG